MDDGAKAPPLNLSLFEPTPPEVYTEPEAPPDPPCACPWCKNVCVGKRPVCQTHIVCISASLHGREIDARGTDKHAKVLREIVVACALREGRSPEQMHAGADDPETTQRIADILDFIRNGPQSTGLEIKFRAQPPIYPESGLTPKAKSILAEWSGQKRIDKDKLPQEAKDRLNALKITSGMISSTSYVDRECRLNFLVHIRAPAEGETEEDAERRFASLHLQSRAEAREVERRYREEAGHTWWTPPPEEPEPEPSPKESKAYAVSIESPVVSEEQAMPVASTGPTNGVEKEEEEEELEGGIIVINEDREWAGLKRYRKAADVRKAAANKPDHKPRLYSFVQFMKGRIPQLTGISEDTKKEHLERCDELIFELEFKMSGGWEEEA